jgi:hypothetical protein
MLCPFLAKINLPKLKDLCQEFEKMLKPLKKKENT